MEPAYYKLEVRKNQHSSKESVDIVYITPRGVFFDEPNGLSHLHLVKSAFTHQFREDNSPSQIELQRVKDEELEELVKKLDNTFIYGDKVVYIPEGKTYDFGYMGQTGMAIIYEEGENNMQDSCAVNPKDLRKIKG